MTRIAERSEDDTREECLDCGTLTDNVCLACGLPLCDECANASDSQTCWRCDEDDEDESDEDDEGDEDDEDVDDDGNGMFI